MSDPTHRRHPASLLPILTHSPLLVHLVGTQVNRSMVHYVARQIAKVIRIQGQSTAAANDLPTPHKAGFANHLNSPVPRLIPLEDFIVRLVNAANVQVATLLTTLIYLERLRARVPSMSEGLSATSP